MTSAASNEYRLTRDDEMRAFMVMSETVAGWGKSRGVDGATTLERIGAHAIGCTLADLRDSETDWLAATAAALVR